MTYPQVTIIGEEVLTSLTYDITAGAKPLAGGEKDEDVFFRGLLSMNTTLSSLDVRDYVLHGEIDIKSHHFEELSSSVEEITAESITSEFVRIYNETSLPLDSWR